MSNMDEYVISETYWKALKVHKQRNQAKGNGFGYVLKDWKDVAPAIRAGKDRGLFFIDRGEDKCPRYPTPTEVESLQGFPPNWTALITKAQRYKCLGNAVTTNVITQLVDRMFDDKTF